ncbi:MAG TPA: hypothetical protein VFQ92_11205 [Blastocatellia bacterium]|nr:hypothetical protein [Blastocatellia bacterium]
MKFCIIASKAAAAVSGLAVFGYRRQIVVRDIPDPDRPGAPISLRQIDVTISYSVGSKQRQETFTSYVANYRTRQARGTDAKSILMQRRRCRNRTV